MPTFSVTMSKKYLIMVFSGDRDLGTRWEGEDCFIFLHSAIFFLPICINYYYHNYNQKQALL